MPFPQNNANPTSPRTGFTQREADLIHQCKLVMSKSFQKEFANDDEKILAFINLVVADINYVPPLTDYTLETISPFFDTIINLGVQMYATLILAQKWSLEDISYNDGGFTLTLDRVSKLSSVQEKFYKLYTDKTTAVKRNQFNAVVLGTPRYANSLGMFIRLALR